MTVSEAVVVHKTALRGSAVDRSQVFSCALTHVDEPLALQAQECFMIEIEVMILSLHVIELEATEIQSSKHIFEVGFRASLWVEVLES